MSVRPGDVSSVDVEVRPPPRPAVDEVLVRGHYVGVCGTDRAVAAGRRGRLPDGRDRIVLGHESLGSVISAPAGSGLSPGDLVVGMVRRPDPEPCRRCAAGEWDLCLNGRYTSCGISGRDGYGAQQWCVKPAYAVTVDPRLGSLGVLVEPTSVLVKAWERIEALPAADNRAVLVSGAGTMGLLAALLAVQLGYRTSVLARRWTSRRTSLVTRLGAVPLEPADVAAHPPPDVVMETTGAPSVLAGLIPAAARNAVVCLAGFAEPPPDGTPLAPVMNQLVATNGLVFGTVNAAPRHYKQAVTILAASDPKWLRGMVTRWVPLVHWPDALRRRHDDLKVIVDLS